MYLEWFPDRTVGGAGQGGGGSLSIEELRNVLLPPNNPPALHDVQSCTLTVPKHTKGLGICSGQRLELTIQPFSRRMVLLSISSRILM